MFSGGGGGASHFCDFFVRSLNPVGAIQSCTTESRGEPTTYPPDRCAAAAAAASMSRCMYLIPKRCAFSVRYEKTRGSKRIGEVLARSLTSRQVKLQEEGGKPQGRTRMDQARTDRAGRIIWRGGMKRRT